MIYVANVIVTITYHSGGNLSRRFLAKDEKGLSSFLQHNIDDPAAVKITVEVEKSA